MPGSALLIAQTALAVLTPFPDADLTAEQRVLPGTSRVLEVRAADGKAPPWALRVASSTTGLQCSTVGQVHGADFGLVGQDGVFRAVPEANADACGQPDRLIGERVFAARASEDVRTVVYGVAGSGLTRVSLAPVGGRERVVPHSPEGGFVASLQGYPEDAAATVTLTFASGETRRHRFPSANGTTVPDPDGGRAWRVQAFALGVKPGQHAPRVQTACVNFSTARGVPGEPNASSPPVCGLEPARRGVKLEPLYFQTRRLSGDGPGEDFMAGNWNHHPARMAVYGVARGAERIVVRAGRFRATVAPRLNQTFLVFLPLSTKRRAVSVTVDGKRYGPSHGVVAPPKPVAAAAQSAEPRRGRLADGRFSPSSVHYKVRNASIPIRIEDPAGGLPWVLREFDADRITLKRPARTLAGGRIVGRNHCVQVGRLQGGRFGWVYGDGVFRPTPDVVDPLLQCTSRKQPRAVADLVTTLGPGPAFVGTVVWGQLPGASAVQVAGLGPGDGAAVVSKGGMFLRLAGPDARPTAAARVSGGGRAVALEARRPSPLARDLKFPTLSPGTERLESPVPDPAGGPGWAVLASQTAEGVPCDGGNVRVVAGRPGSADLHLGLFHESILSSAACRPLNSGPNAKYPCVYNWGGGDAEELEGQDPVLERGRIERRLLAGRTFFNAQCRADVEQVTLESPRDRRTLVPSAVGHAVLAVYDGLFVDGAMTITMRLAGGKTATQELPLGMF